MPNAMGQAANSAMMGYASAMNASKGAMDSAYNTARGDLNGNDYYNQWYGTGQNANQMYANALGLNGSSGNQAATNAFQAGPGYQWQVQQGLDALNRSAAARGALAGGGQSMALLNYGQQQANQAYNNWLSNLNGLSTQGMGAAAGKTAQQNNLANLDYGYGKDLSNIYMGGTQAAMGALMNGAQQDAAANAQQNANLMGGLLGGLKLGTSLLTAPMTGGTSLLGKLFF